MSKDTTLFHLPLDEIRRNVTTQTSTIANVGGLNIETVLHGNPYVAHDPQMGTCLRFDGVDDYIEFVNLNNFKIGQEFTFCVWAKFEKFNHYSRLFNLFIEEGTNTQAIYLANENKSNTLVFGVNKKQESISNAYKKNEWQHIVVTGTADGRNGTVRIYVDGIEKGQNGDMLYKTFATMIWTHGYIGKSNWSNDGLFCGSMGHFRFYSRKLEATEIKSVMQQDKSAMAKVRETTLLKVDLYTVRDDDHKPILYIEAEDKGEPLEASLSNPHVAPVKFIGAGNPSESNYHIQWRFRRNVISEKYFNNLKGTGTKEITVGEVTWKYAAGTSADNREDYISFIRKDGAFQLATGEITVIRLEDFNAEPRGGARNTRIEVRFRTEAQDPGSIIRHMEVQSHLGMKTIPLIARIKGSNTVLNDGKEPNELRIEISHIKSNQSVKLNYDAANTEKRSRFTLILDKELFRESENSPELKVKATGNSKYGFNVDLIDGKAQSGNTGVSQIVNASTNFDGLNTQPKKDGQEHATFTFDVQKEGLEITEANPIKINITNWITNAANGTHNILLRYEDIDDYWDGAWVIPVECNPLVIRGGNIGIGTDDPLEKAHVEGNMLIDGKLLIGDKDKYKTALTEFNEEYGNTNKDEPGIIFAPDHGNTDHAWLRFHSRSGSAHNLEIQVAKNGQDHLVLNPQGGNVGVGTDNPIAKLDIQTKTRTEYQNKPHPTSINGLYVTGDFSPDSNGVEFRHTNGSQGIGFGYNTIYATGNNTNQDLNLKPRGTGKVGIGTISPGAKLHIHSDENGDYSEVARFSCNAKKTVLRITQKDGYNKDVGIENDEGKIHFWTSEPNKSDNFWRMTILQNGRVGIGTDSPTEKLHVNGNIKANRFIGISLVWGPKQDSPWLNNWDAVLNWDVPDGHVMVGLYSTHSNHHEDRKWIIHYKKLSLSGV